MPDNCYHCRSTLRMHHPEPQPHYNPGKVQIQVQSVPFRAISEIDARRNCVQPSPTFSEHRRKLFIKYFPLSGRGKGPATQARQMLPCFAMWSAQLLPHPAAVSTVEHGVQSKLTDAGQPNPTSGS